MPNTIAYKIIEACQEAGCPVCRLEQQAVERYLDNHFYENVNSPAWRERLRAELALFIRKNDYQLISEGFGKEGDAWLRAVGVIAGSRKRG